MNSLAHSSNLFCHPLPAQIRFCNKDACANDTGRKSDLICPLIARRANPRLKRVAEKTNFTAFIAPNDAFAQEYFFWFSSLGIKIPEDISIVSFDNNLDTHLLPLSTVDFGFQRLGYQAAHLFIGDIGITADSGGTIISRSELIDRGSIAAPRKEPLNLA